MTSSMVLVGVGTFDRRERSRRAPAYARVPPTTAPLVDRLIRQRAVAEAHLHEDVALGEHVDAVAQKAALAAAAHDDAVGVEGPPPSARRVEHASGA